MEGPDVELEEGRSSAGLVKDEEVRPALVESLDWGGLWGDRA